MSAVAWSQYKFTDRDVRDYPALADLAREFVIEYTGDFSFLRDMKLTVDMMTVGMVRGVLNCMRNDPRASIKLIEIMKQPRPDQPAANGDGDFSEDETVVPFRRRRRSVKRTNDLCEETSSHYAHWSGGEFNNFCPGIPWPINRERTSLPAKVKRKYAIAKSGTLIHLVAKEGSMCSWYPADAHGYWYRHTELYVKLVCRYPSSLRDPVLVDELPEHHWNLKLCPYCIEEVRLQCPELLLSNESESISPPQPDEANCGASVESASRTAPQLVFMQESAVPSES